MGKPKLKRVALVGFAPLTRGLLPHDQKDMEVWTLNEAKGMMLPRIDRLFQLHPRYMWDPNARDPDYVGWMNAQDCPIYMLEKQFDIPNSERYPIEKMATKFDSYLTSTFAYMLSMAIDEGYQRIEIYGIDLAAEEEYRYQRAGTEFLIGWAKGLGIDVYIPKECPLLKAPLYGIYGAQEAKTLWTEEQLTARINLLSQQKAKLMADLNAIEGAIQEDQTWRITHQRDVHSNNGLEHKRFAGLDTVQAGAVVGPSDGTVGHTGVLEEVIV